MVRSQEAQVLIAVLAALAVPALGAIALQWWAVRLVRRAAAPAWANWVLPGIVVLTVVSTLVVLIGGFRALGDVSADQKQAVLSKSISEAMNTGALPCLALPIWIAVLSYFALRRRAP